MKQLSKGLLIDVVVNHLNSIRIPSCSQCEAAALFPSDDQSTIPAKKVISLSSCCGQAAARDYHSMGPCCGTWKKCFLFGD